MNPELQTKLEEAIKYRDAERAWDVLVLAKKDNIKLSRLDYLRLNYIRINALDIDKVLGLLKESLLAAYQIPDYDLETRLADYFELINYIDLQVDFLFKLKAILEEHQELLGDKKITVNGRGVAPTFANWITDYLSGVNTGMKDALGEMRYINTGPNLKMLSIGQRKVLQSVLRIYDHVAELVDIYEKIPSKLPPEEEQALQDLAIKKFEKEYQTDASVLLGSTEPELVANPAEIVVTPQPAVAQSQPKFQPAPAPYKIPLLKDLDLSTEPKKGLVFDTPSNVDLSKVAEERQKKEQAKIQADKIQSKLDELKKRKK